MITKSGTSSDYINHFRGLQKDVDSKSHMPNNNGIMECTGILLENGDELYCMDTHLTLLYDLENNRWLP